MPIEHLVIEHNRITMTLSLSLGSESEAFLHCARILESCPNAQIVLADSWQAREARRFFSRTYTAMPDYFPSMPGHFLHVSQENPNLVAYTESDAKGIADRQTSCKPGRYLTKYFESLGNVEIERITKRLTAGDLQSLQFADSRAEIRRVYENGPQSCMKRYNGVAPIHDGIHSTEAYAAGDLAIAYLSGESGAVLARTVCWPAKKVYLSSVYPKRGHDDYEHSIKLTTLLESAGFAIGSLQGARMLKLEFENSFLMPYLDDSDCLRDCGDFFTLDSRGEYCGNSPNGLIQDSESATCYHCNDSCDPDNLLGYNGDDYCDSCYDELFGECERCGDVKSRDDLCYVEDADVHWCQSCTDRYTSTCESCHDTFLDDNLVSGHGLDNVCEFCLEKHIEESPSDCDECNPAEEEESEEESTESPINTELVEA